jgi:hypothetical protein
MAKGKKKRKRKVQLRKSARRRMKGIARSEKNAVH